MGYISSIEFYISNRQSFAEGVTCIKSLRLNVTPGTKLKFNIVNSSIVELGFSKQGAVDLNSPFLISLPLIDGLTSESEYYPLSFTEDRLLASSRIMQRNNQSLEVIYSTSFSSLILLEVDCSVLLFLNWGVPAK